MHPSAAHGTRNHEAVQSYLTTGEVDSDEPGVRACLEILPVKPLIPEAGIEKSLKLVYRGVPFTGFIDIESGDIQIDLKFTRSLKYVDTAPDNVQRVIYAADYFARNPNASTLTSVWTISQFDGRDAANYPIEYNRGTVIDLMDTKVVPAAIEILRDILLVKDWRSARKNTASCGLYPPQGCHLRATCKPPFHLPKVKL